MIESQAIFEPKNTPMSVAVFASGSGGNLNAAIGAANDNPELLSVDLVVTDRPDILAIDIAKQNSIPTIVGNFEQKCGKWSEAKGNEKRKEAYRLNAQAFHDKILEKIQEYEEETNPIDLVVLSYRRWIHGNLLKYFEGRMINQHAGDLTVLDANGQRAYIGINPVLYALQDGQTKTRTSTFLVRDGHDTGEILAQGPWVEYQGDAVTSESAYKHELLQKEKSDWPALAFVLKEIARGLYKISTSEQHQDGCRVVYYDEKPLPYGGVNL